MWLLNNSIFQIVLGAIVSFAGSVWANYLFMNKKAKDYEAGRAYNRFVDAVVRLETVPDPAGLLPLELADRAGDLRYAIRYKNPKLNPEPIIQNGIKQAATIRKEMEDKKMKQRAK